MSTLAIDVEERIVKHLEGLKFTSASFNLELLISDQLGEIGKSIEEMRDDGEDLDTAELRNWAAQVMQVAAALDECQRRPDGA
jgi:hypothetical protein